MTVCPVCLSVCDVGLLWSNGWTDQDETWRGGRPRPGPHCVGRGPSSPSPKGHRPPIFSPCLLWPNSWLDQDATWYGVGLSPGDIVLDRAPRSPSSKRGHSPQFSAHVSCVQAAGWIKMPLGTEVVLGPGHIVLDEDAALSPKRWHTPLNFRPMSIVVKRLDESR